MKNFINKFNFIEIGFFYMKVYLGIEIAELDLEKYAAALSHIRMRFLQRKLIENGTDLGWNFFRKNITTGSC